MPPAKPGPEGLGNPYESGLVIRLSHRRIQQDRENHGRASGNKSSNQAIGPIPNPWPGVFCGTIAEHIYEGILSPLASLSIRVVKIWTFILRAFSFDQNNPIVINRKGFFHCTINRREEDIQF